MAKYHTLGKVNEPVYMLGFPPLQLAGLFLMLIFIAVGGIVLLNVYIAIILIVVALFIILKIGGNIAKNNQLGNPDFVESEFMYKSMPKVIEDTTGVCNLLLKNGENN